MCSQKLDANNTQRTVQITNNHNMNKLINAELTLYLCTIKLHNSNISSTTAKTSRYKYSVFITIELKRSKRKLAMKINNVILYSNIFY